MEIACREAADRPPRDRLPPEDVVLFTGPPAEHSTSLRNVLPGMVKSVSPSGRLLHVVVATEWAEIAALVTRAAAEELGLEVGCSAVVAFKASAVHPIARHERRLS
jgi:molybdopterin-binding protein